MVSVDDLNPFAFLGQTTPAPSEFSIFDGSKFSGGYGDTQVFELDYWTLRARSTELFYSNPYARGLLRRLVTNEINTGLTPEACPDEKIIGLPEDALVDWSEEVENRFLLWGKNPVVCDWLGASTFGAIQRLARLEALIAGDVLVVLRQPRGARVPQVQLVSGDAVRTPLLGETNIKSGHRIEHGVELDLAGRQVAYWVRQDDGSAKRLPAFGRRSGRRTAWLVYGTDRRLDDLRGQPLLSILLQSLKEIDRYRDSTQRKAVINSILAMFIQKDANMPGSLPTTGGAKRKTTGTVTDGDGSTRTRSLISQVPGVVYEELQTGEKPVGFHNQGVDTNFGVFETAIIQAVAWASEIPPEILTLAFSNNYSASQAAINEFKIYLNRVWSDWGETFCTPVYIEWLISEALSRRIDAGGLLSSWRSQDTADVYGAWTAVDWYGSIKPSTDMLKQTKGSAMLVEHGWSTNARESRITTGTKFSKNVKRLKSENAQLVEARRPLAEFQAEFGAAAEDVRAESFDGLEAWLDEQLEARGLEQC